jgi:hypothetical protein
MITLSCSRWYLNLDGAHLCLSSHSRIAAISNEKLASEGSRIIIVRILLCSRNGPAARHTAILGTKQRRVGGQSPTPLQFWAWSDTPARSKPIHTKRQRNVSHASDYLRIAERQRDRRRNTGHRPRWRRLTRSRGREGERKESVAQQSARRGWDNQGFPLCFEHATGDLDPVRELPLKAGGCRPTAPKAGQMTSSDHAQR